MLIKIFGINLNIEKAKTLMLNTEVEYYDLVTKEGIGGATITGINIFKAIATPIIVFDKSEKV